MFRALSISFPSHNAALIALIMSKKKQVFKKHGDKFKCFNKYRL